MPQGNILIVRHGETESNQTQAIVGITDVKLTQKWIQDAHNTWVSIKQNVDVIITSPQKRAIHCAEIIRKHQNIPIVEHPILHPQDFWKIEWLTLIEAKQRWLWKYLHTDTTNKYLHKSGWWESPQEMEKKNSPRNSYITPSYK